MKRFASFSLDTANECIRQGQFRFQLPPKVFAVLRYLVDNPGRIVTNQELLDAVWPDTFVEEAVLKVCILEVRKAIGEKSKEPKFYARESLSERRRGGRRCAHRARALHPTFRRKRGIRAGLRRPGTSCASANQVNGHEVSGSPAADQ